MRVRRRPRGPLDAGTLAGDILREGQSRSWEHVDSCWGFYGPKWAQEAALEALEGVRDEE